jgi:hypothetical protein
MPRTAINRVIQSLTIIMGPSRRCPKFVIQIIFVVKRTTCMLVIWPTSFAFFDSVHSIIIISWHAMINIQLSLPNQFYRSSLSPFLMRRWLQQRITQSKSKETQRTLLGTLFTWMQTLTACSSNRPLMFIARPAGDKARPRHDVLLGREQVVFLAHLVDQVQLGFQPIYMFFF